MKKSEVVQFDGMPIRLDGFLAGEFSDLSRNYLKRLIKNGSVLVNGQNAKPSFLLDEPCEIKVTWPHSQTDTKLFEKNVIYEDKHIIVFSKPSGMLTHPQSPVWEHTPTAAFLETDNLISLLISARKEILKTRMQRCGLVHRLDSDTSGVMVIAKTVRAQNSLLNQFKNREVTKIYKAICSGEIPDKQGIIDVPIGRICGGKIKASSIGRPSITEYKVIRQTKGYAFVKLTPKTGRTNQLRVHLLWLKCPVLGDKVYKGEDYRRLMLHSEVLSFTHPHTKEKVTFTIKCPKEFDDVWKKLSSAKK